MSRLATLNNKHSATPDRSYHHAHCTDCTRTQKKDDEHFSSLISRNCTAHECLSDWPLRAEAGSRALDGAFFLFSCSATTVYFSSIFARFNLYSAILVSITPLFTNLSVRHSYKGLLYNEQRYSAIVGPDSHILSTGSH